MRLSNLFKKVKTDPQYQQYLAMAQLGGLIAGYDISPYLAAVGSISETAEDAEAGRKLLRADASAAMRAVAAGMGDERAATSLTNMQLAAYGLRLEIESKGGRALKKLLKL